MLTDTLILYAENTGKSIFVHLGSVFFFNKVFRIRSATTLLFFFSRVGHTAHSFSNPVRL